MKESSEYQNLDRAQLDKGGDMKTDKLTKLLLGIIAIALWMIALNPWLRPVPVAAQGDVSFQCTGKLTGDQPWPLTSPTLINYSVKLDCD